MDTILALAFGSAVVGIAVLIGMSLNKKLVSEGQIINRDPDFARYSETFTLKATDCDQITQKVKAFPYDLMKVDMKGNSAKQVFIFTAGLWAAHLYRISDEESCLSYRFEFTNWTSDGGQARDALNMNRLLTSVEKMFLSVDENTRVQKDALELKRKHKFF